MRRIIYCSQATYDFTGEELISLLEQSRKNNDDAGLSGMLLYSSQSFLQMLEGPEEALTATYERIGRDARHTNLRLLSDVEVARPMFPEWTMGFDHIDDDELAEELEGFTPATTYPLVNPDLITNGVVAETLLSLYAKNKVQ